jgi:hypothetical protein
LSDLRLLAGRWHKRKWLLDLPREASVGFVTGATVANFVCLQAGLGGIQRVGAETVSARHAVRRRRLRELGVYVLNFSRARRSAVSSASGAPKRTIN